MPRPPGEHERLVRYMVSWDTWDYPEDNEDHRTNAVWIHAEVRGPITEPGHSGAVECNDRLVLESRDLFAPERIVALHDELIRSRELALPIRQLMFHSDRFDAPDGFMDLNTEPTTGKLWLDEFDCLRVEADLATDEWIEFGVGVFERMLSSPETLRHWERRYWQLMCLVSEQLRIAVQTRISAAASEATFYELETAFAPRGQYLAVAPHRIEDRERIVHALLNDRAVFTQKQIGIILHFVRDWCDTEGRPYSVPADGDTVARLIRLAHLTPVFGQRFSTRQITHRLLPIAIKQPKWGPRYGAVQHELRGRGISVPDEPIADFR